MSGPLQGIRVLDFSTLLPGPCATMHLADMGAEVIRIESFTRPDMLRLLPPQVGRVSAAHAYLNRGKRSVAVDLKKAGAREWILKMADTADVLVEQFRPGVMARLGLSYDEVSRRNPRIVYCSLTGYGQQGPLSARAGHDINYLALSGAASNSGRKDTGPTLHGIQIADVAGGAHHAVMAIEAALIRALKTGQGDYIDISMTDAALTLNHLAWACKLAGGPTPEPEGDLLNGAGIYGYYRTSDDRYMAVGSLEPQFAQALCDALGAPQRAAQLVSQAPSDRVAARQWLSAQFRTQTQAHWIDVFARVDACVEPVLNFDEVHNHPHFTARQMFCKVGGVEQPASALKFRDQPNLPAHNDPGREPGADTCEMLRQAGASEETVEALLAKRIFYQP